MIITRAPFRISLFGGSTDYESFYKDHGSLIIGTTINKYIYTSFRVRPDIVSDRSVITYSKLETPTSIEEIKHPLIRETLRYFNIKEAIDLHFFADIPSRTGLGGSSAFCVSLIKALQPEFSKKKIAKIAIEIERHILLESGGIQDQIWAAYGGFNRMEIDAGGNFFVKPMPLSQEFLNKLHQSMILIYTKSQRDTDLIAQSHEDIDKSSILHIANEAYKCFEKQNIKDIGELLLETWKQKKTISNLITNSKIDSIICSLIDMGFYGAKLLGSGGSGFVLGIGNRNSISQAKKVFQKNVLDFSFENEGISSVINKSVY